MDTDESAMPSMKLWKWPFWRGVVMLTCAGLAVMLLVAAFEALVPSVVSLFSTKPFDYTFIHLKAEDGIDSVGFTDPLENDGFLVATMLFDHDTRRAKGGVHLGSGPCDASERTWSEGWMAVHSAGTGTVLPVTRGHCWNAFLIGDAEEAVLWVLMDRKWWQPKARLRLTRNEKEKTSPALPRPVPSQPEVL